MKIKKLFGLAVMAFTLSIGAFAGINLLSSSEKAEEVAATSSSTITEGAKRINVLVPTDSSRGWIFDADAKIFLVVFLIQSKTSISYLIPILEL